MDRTALEAEMRPAKNTQGDLNQMRKEDRVPAIVYGRGKDSIPVAVNGKAVRQILSTEAGLNAIVELNIQNGQGNQKETVMIREVQRDIIIQERLLHIDFIRISLTEKILANVPLNYMGEAAGVKEGGVLQIIKREAEVYCLPSAIPDMLDVDVVSLAIGDSLLVKDITLPEGVEMKADPDEPLVQILSPTMPDAEDGEEGTEAAGVAEGEDGQGSANTDEE